MIDVKPILASKTVWGGIGVVLGQLANLAGYTVTDMDLSATIQDCSTIFTMLCGLFTIYGRIKATKRLTSPTEGKAS